MELFRAEGILKHFPRSNFRLSIPSLTLAAGSITGVVGENGNGKTTLLDIVAGESHGEGNYSYFSNNIDSKSKWLELKNNIGFIPQRIPRWFGTLEQNLILKASLEGISPNDIDKELDELLDFLGLQKYRKLKWTEISTGYRLRFELARVLIGNPKLLVLDEPLANLDINTQQKFLSDLKELLSKKDYPLAVILSSQQLHEIESVADQMIFLRQGQVVYSGSLEAIAEEETTFLYEVQLIHNDSLTVEAVLKKVSSEFKKVGPYYQVTTENDVSSFLSSLTKSDCELKYFRNLSQSTKRFFN
ncbi:MAG: ABC transporter ATP-binding protein [Bacteroidetes bacterium]|nr:MAG: ABC transporter ATP-binding protein [Bacteroidota bacterium]